MLLVDTVSLFTRAYACTRMALSQALRYAFPFSETEIHSPRTKSWSPTLRTTQNRCISDDRITKYIFAARDCIPGDKGAVPDALA